MNWQWTTPITSNMLVSPPHPLIQNTYTLNLTWFHWFFSSKAATDWQNRLTNSSHSGTSMIREIRLFITASISVSYCQTLLTESNHDVCCMNHYVIKIMVKSKKLSPPCDVEKCYPYHQRINANRTDYSWSELYSASVENSYKWPTAVHQSPVFTYLFHLYYFPAIWHCSSRPTLLNPRQSHYFLPPIS